MSNINNMNKFKNFVNLAENFDISSLKIAIIYGGEWEESEISKMSANGVYSTVKSDVKEVKMINCDANLIENLKNFKPNVVFNAMHGTFGEDGKLPVILDFLQIPYTHSGYYSSFIGMQKDLSRKIFEDNNIPIAKGISMSKQNIIDEKYVNLFDQWKAKKLVIKPNNSGSSVGVKIVSKEEKPVFNDKFDHLFNNYVIEEFIDGIEISVPVLMNSALGCLELLPIDGFYDYKNKYTNGKTKHVYPAQIPNELYQKALEYAEIAHKSLKCKTVSRADFRVDIKKNRLALLEINTHPGFTEFSITNDVAAREGIAYKNLVKLLIKDASFEK